MNKKLILWIAAVIVTLLVLFLHRRMGPYYPVSGTLQVGEEKVTFVLPKIHYGKDPLEIKLRNDLVYISGKLFWRKLNDNSWNSDQLVNEGKYLTGKIKPGQAGESIIYKGQLYYKDSTYTFPRSGQTELIFEGKRPASVLNVLYFFLFGGILLAVRASLEYFNPDDKRRLFSFAAVSFLSVAALVFYPFIKSYEMDVINRSVPPITSLFEMPLIAISLIWMVCTVLIFWKKNKLFMLISGILTIIIYQFSKFY